MGGGIEKIMASVVIIRSVRPVFKLKTGDSDSSIKLVEDQYLYAISLGAESSLVKGGAYYLGKDGKPYYPSKKDKPKPIPVAKYFFYLSKTSLSNKDIKELNPNRGECLNPVKLSIDPKQTVILQAAIPIYVYIMGTDKRKNPNKFYFSAKKHYKIGRRFPDDWVIEPIHSAKIAFDDLLYKINRLAKPFADIYIVSHANEHGWLGFPLKEEGKKKSMSYYSLREALDDNSLVNLSSTLEKRNSVKGVSISLA